MNLMERLEEIPFPQRHELNAELFGKCREAEELLMQTEASWARKVEALWLLPDITEEGMVQLLVAVRYNLDDEAELMESLMLGAELDRLFGGCIVINYYREIEDFEAEELKLPSVREKLVEAITAGNLRTIYRRV